MGVIKEHPLINHVSVPPIGPAELAPSAETDSQPVQSPRRGDAIAHDQHSTSEGAPWCA